MSYRNRATATATRMVKHFATDEATREMKVTLTRRATGGLNTTTLVPTAAATSVYTTRGFVMSDTDFFERVNLARIGTLTIGAMRRDSFWQPSAVEPIEGDEVVCDGQTGTVQAVHRSEVLWILDCTQ